MKNFLIFLVVLSFNFFANSLAKEKLPIQFIEYKYELSIPEKFDLNISGKNYIKYLKQIKLTSQKDNLNSRVINSTKKRWVNSEIKVNQNDLFKIKIKIHGDWNDHISFPYSSLRIKTRKNKYFNQLKEFILFKPVTRNYNAEIFSTIFLQELGFLAPYTREMKLKINDNSPQKYLLQEKINKNFIERAGLREAPIIEYDERHRWNTIKRDEKLDKIKYANIFKLDNETFLENPDKELINENKLYIVISALSNSSNLINLSSYENIHFEIALSLLSACHGLIDHNRKFYFDGINEKFIPIYYDGMAFEKDTNFCENQRLTKNDDFFLEKNLIFFEKKFLDKSFKEKIKNKFDKLTLDNSKFENYWTLLNSNYLKLKKRVSEKNASVDLKEKKIQNKKDNIQLLQPNYPLIYYFKEDGKYFECFKINNSNYKDKNLISNTGEIVTLNSDNFCKKIRKNKLVKILKNKIFYTPDNDKDLQIHPTFLPKKISHSIEKVFFDISKNFEKITLESDKIYFLYASDKNQINNLNLFSKSPGDTAVIFIGELPTIKNISYDEFDFTKKINTKLQRYNITGCVNFYYVKANIDKIKINSSSCEDGINVISSKIEFNNIEINRTISDGIDMDFSKVKIKNITSSGSDGDCVDLSFGNYIFKNIKVKDCYDKGVSIGENSTVFLGNVEISQNNIGIAIKDSSFAEIKSINTDTDNNTCLSLYNKKPEFSDGKLFYENIDKKCLENSQFSNKSIIKKAKINEKN